MSADDVHLKRLGLNRWQPRDEGSDEATLAQADTPHEPVAAAGDDAPEKTPAEVEGNGEPAIEVDPAGGTLRLNVEGQHRHAWRKTRREVEECTLCELHRTRTNTVFGVGAEEANLMLIGEAPGADEDKQGEPFVGRAGRLLDSMLAAIGLDREQVYIANILKCRPPNNENPTSEQAEKCRPYLDRQIEMIQPKVILALGAVAAQNLLDEETPISKLRGTVHEIPGTGMPLIATYHPAFLLRRPQSKAEALKDLLFLCEFLEQQGITPGPAAE